MRKNLEVPDRDGLFLAGEIYGRALIRNAFEHGRIVAGAAHNRQGTCGSSTRESQDSDLLVVGVGPVGLACALEALERGMQVIV